MPKLRVNEIFYSLQGEGARKGSANIFVRFAHCNLECGFCDTEFESFRELTVDELLEECSRFACKNIVFTGGEPLLQLTIDVVRAFKKPGYFLAIETNGTIIPPKGLDWITVSPKVAEHVLAKNFRRIHINELKYVRNKSQGIPRSKVKADHYYISPEFDGDYPNEENIKHCIDLVKQNAEWKLSLQEHKLLKIR
ncbi:MAG TPA: 7-carboxy-7-deazaguanine synthase QueE [Candidatus Acidoferrales bacterium]|nr:7-carboxy-7-deazaguanine synthase QueE [Candidatus Acidoferrales bacterium]